MTFMVLACRIAFCAFLALAALALGVSIFTNNKSYPAFFLSMIAALVVWSLSHLI